jgi:transcription elongation GreA/GreB family factor
MKELEDAPELTVVAHAAPQRVTPSRLKRLRAELSHTDDPERRAQLQERIDSALLTPPPADREVVAFGSRVSVEDEARSGAVQTFELVDEADVDIPEGCIGMESPLAQALLGSRAGDTVRWRRPAGDHSLKITAIEYEKD